MIAITCNKKNIVKVLRCKNVKEFDKIMKDVRLKWGHLVHKETGMLVDQRHAVSE
jgi:hypothetical protein